MVALCGATLLQGLPTAKQLAAQLPAAMRHVRQGSYLPERGAGLASIGVAKLTSLLKVLHLPPSCLLSRKQARSRQACAWAYLRCCPSRGMS